MSKRISNHKGLKSGKKYKFDVPLKPDGLSYKDLVSQANDAIERALPTLQKHSVLFDSRLNGKSFETCVTSLVCSRILKKFVPTTGATTDLRSVAIMGFLEYEADLEERTKSFKLSQSPLLWTLRRRCHSLLKNYRVDYSDEDIDVGPGETFITSHGYTELIAKLSDKTNWTTTLDCLEDTRLLCWFNRTLRRAAMLHFGKVSSARRAEMRGRYKGHPNLKFAMFCELLDDILIIVLGARISSVPKNNETDRVINVEALFPIILQRHVAKALLKCLKQAGYAMDGSLIKAKRQNESDRQHIHGWMIRFSKYATADFSNASNSVVLKAVCALFPQKVVHDLTKLRSDLVVLPDGHTHELYMLSSMGNGFTFEVMTCLLLSACRVFTEDCSVFGDDVIIPNEHAAAFLDLTKLLGFVPNNKKTFIASNFRESCGKFYHDDYGYLTSFDIKRCNSYSDIITVHNKLFLVLEEHSEHLDENVAACLKGLVNELSSLGCASRTGPVPYCSNGKIENLGLYFYSYDPVRAHMRRNDLRDRYTYHINKLRNILADYQLDCVKQDPSLNKERFVIVNIASSTPQRSTRTRNELLVNSVRILTGRPVNETVKGRLRYSTKLALISVETGRIYRLAQLRLEQGRRRRTG